MTRSTRAESAGHWKEIVASFLMLGATSYGGPATMGVMQSEVLESSSRRFRSRFLPLASIRFDFMASWRRTPRGVRRLSRAASLSSWTVYARPARQRASRR